MKHANSKRRWLTAAVAGIAMLTASAWVSATPIMHYRANFTPLNDSGVTGTANLTLDLDLDTLTVNIQATGLVEDHTHVQHIHGTFDPSGNPTNATTPTSAQDTNGDGVLTVTEGAVTYGPILLPLSFDDGTFPTASDGTIDYMRTFDLTNSAIYSADFTESDLIPLYFRELVIHGAFTPIDIDNGGLDGETHFDAGAYVATLPVASAEIFAVVPEPPVFGMMLGGLGLLLGFVWLRRADNRKKALG